MAETIAYACLVYLFVGSVVWMLLDGASAAARATTYGRAVTASAAMIVGWPRAVWAWMKAGRARA